MPPTLTFLEFTAYLIEAFLLGSLIGAERQFRQRTAGLRTNALVSLGAAAFVMIAGMTPGPLKPTTIAAQIVSGIGFIGGGVIFREGLSVTGLNTAATLWCSAAIGTLCGSGFGKEAAVAAAVVLFANVGLRPVAHKLERQRTEQSKDAEFQYLLRLRCKSSDESHMRALLMHAMATPNLIVRALSSEDIDQAGNMEIRATLTSFGRQDSALEQVVSRLSLEPSVSSVAWEVVTHGVEQE